MNVPTKLITTTIDEFKAEGYTCTEASVNGDAIRTPDATYQTVTLSFVKKDTEEKA